MSNFEFGAYSFVQGPEFGVKFFGFCLSLCKNQGFLLEGAHM